MSDRVRLHITPFNPDLLSRYIPASLQPHASNISFHAVETFPERGFGFVELPAVEAQKLKNKLAGMTLKGVKVKIEEARKEKKRKVEGEEEVERKERKKAKKAKKEQGVLEGHELAEGRIVKRGWSTEDVGKKGKDGKVKKEKEGKTLKFKTLVPPNAVPIEKDEKKEKKEKKTPEEKVAKAEKRARKKEALVKEFANTTKLNFPNSAGDKKHKHYEEGVGWVDEEGNVLEPEPPSKKRKREKREKKERKAAKKIATPEPEPEEEPESEPEPDQPVASAAAVLDDAEDVDKEEPAAPALTAAAAAYHSSSEDEDEDEKPPAASESSSEDEDVNEEASAASDSSSEADILDQNLTQAESNTLSNGATTQSRIATPIPVGEVVSEVDELDTKEIHPLEALYKRDSKPAPIDTSFNFFSANDEEEEEVVVPQTPHTKEDLEWRSVRSAAPTPDTAAIGKKFQFSAPEAEESDEEEVEKELGEESEFRKWFYANRGDLNRGWKKRRKEERKVVRQRENRRAGRRVV